MHTRRGFTIIELMMVVAIIAILAAIAYPLYTSRVAKGKQQSGILALENARMAMENYRAKQGGYLAVGQDVTKLPGFDTDSWTAANTRYTLSIVEAHPNTFRMRATCSPSGTPACNIDDDATADVWEINERGVLTAITDDVDN